MSEKELLRKIYKVAKENNIKIYQTTDCEGYALSPMPVIYLRSGYLSQNIIFLVGCLIEIFKHTKPQLDIEALENTFNKIIRRH